MAPDEGATYERVIEVNLDEVPLTVATPGDSRNRLSLAEAVTSASAMWSLPTAADRSPIRAAADVLRGQTIREGVRVTVTPSSRWWLERPKPRHLDLFRSRCGRPPPGTALHRQRTRCALRGRGDGARPTTFDRRMGAPGPVYLVSPAVAAAGRSLER